MARQPLETLVVMMLLSGMENVCSTPASMAVSYWDSAAQTEKHSTACVNEAFGAARMYEKRAVHIGQCFEPVSWKAEISRTHDLL